MPRASGEGSGTRLCTRDISTCIDAEISVPAGLTRLVHASILDEAVSVSEHGDSYETSRQYLGRKERTDVEVSTCLEAKFLIVGERRDILMVSGKDDLAAIDGKTRHRLCMRRTRPSKRQSKVSIHNLGSTMRIFTSIPPACP